MQRIILTILVVSLLFFPLMTQAGPTPLYFIYPDGGSGDDTFKSGLKSLFDYLRTQTKNEISGDFYKNPSDVVAQLETESVDMAVVSPEFFQTYKQKFHLERVADTIPFYSDGPSEKLYIMTREGVDVEALLSEQTPVILLATQKYDKAFLQDRVFHGDEMMKKMTWQLEETPDVLSAIKKIALDEKGGGFVLLTGFEFSTLQKMRKTDQTLHSLKLVFTSPDMPSSSFVIVEKKITPENLQQIKTALFEMSDSLNGLSVLKKLRLKGFAEIQ